jgi:hypothetical protein
MRTLPYVVPDSSQYLNVAVLLLTLQVLGKSPRGNGLLNNERLMIFMYLVKNPVVMSKLLPRLGHSSPHLSCEDNFSVSSLAINVDSLFDNDWIKSLLKHIASLGLLDASYRKTDGFVYLLSVRGEQAVGELTGDYFDKVRGFLLALVPIKNATTSSLNAILNEIFRR